MKRHSEASFPSWLRGVAAAVVLAAVALLAGPAPRRHPTADAGHPAPLENANAAPERSGPPAAPGLTPPQAPSVSRPLMHVKGPMMIVTVTLPRAAHAR